MMTPLQIQMMLHYYAIAEPYSIRDERHANSPAVREQRLELVALGLLENGGDGHVSGYRVTECGRTYVKALCEMPLPVLRYVMPSPIYIDTRSR
jgi:hypothetical protein